MYERIQKGSVTLKKTTCSHRKRLSLRLMQIKQT